ncbi:MAG: helix-turn-helix domain-containing protein [Oscillospiraceae bacterium]
MENEQRYYTVADIKNIIGCSRSSAYHLAKKLPHMNLGRKMYIPISAVEDWLKNNTNEKKTVILREDD